MQIKAHSISRHRKYFRLFFFVVPLLCEYLFDLLFVVVLRRRNSRATTIVNCFASSLFFALCFWVRPCGHKLPLIDGCIDDERATRAAKPYQAILSIHSAHNLHLDATLGTLCNCQNMTAKIVQEIRKFLFGLQAVQGQHHHHVIFVCWFLIRNSLKTTSDSHWDSALGYEFEFGSKCFNFERRF